ncbi:hypothetical protein [Planctobacterium marinum]
MNIKRSVTIKHRAQLTLVLVTALMGNLKAHAQITETSQHGILNVDVGRSPTIDDVPQPVELYGCNNTVVATQVYWDTQNQVVGEIPYGLRISDSGKEYKVSKYYVVSPPAWRNKNQTENAAAKKEAQPFIGLVTPDNFTFKGNKPAQILNLDYRILMPTYLENVPVDFNYAEDEILSCAEQGVVSIPINTDCSDFPWRAGAEGASGIGVLNTSGSTAFLPTLKKNKEPLQCTTTLLHDIMLEHKVFFATEAGLTDTINLTQYHAEQKTMNLVCLPRAKNDVPAGCL